MNRLLYNRGSTVTNLILRNYSAKSTILNFNFVAKEPVRFVYKPLAYQLTNNCLKQFVRKYSSITPINTTNIQNLSKDVIIFKYDNPRFFKLMNIFGLVQFFFWLIFAENVMSNMKFIPVDRESSNYKDLPLYMKINFGENKYKWGLAVFSLVVGTGILFFSWTLSLRTVRYLILRKGANQVAFVTYGPFGNNRIMNVPLNCISAVRTRSADVSSLPIKVKNKMFHYLLDNKGKYNNTDIFDHYINLKRRLD